MVLTLGLPCQVLSGTAKCRNPGLPVMHSPCLQLRGRYGDLFSLQLASESVVVLNGLTALREALVKHSEDTADRPPLHFNDLLGFGPRSQGKCRQWREWWANGH